MKTFITLVALTSLAATPALGSVREAAFSSSIDRSQVQTSMFGGATYRVGLDRRTSDRHGRVALKLSGMSVDPTSSYQRFGGGLELSGGKTGKPALFLAGQDIGDIHAKSRLNGTTTAVIIGGVVLLGVAAVVAVDMYKDEHCIGEHGDCE